MEKRKFILQEKMLAIMEMNKEHTKNIVAKKKDIIVFQIENRIKYILNIKKNFQSKIDTQ